jgi:transcriptional regulator with XRE-family HTH domain
MSLGHVLKLVRINKGFNQKQMAELLGISQNYLSLIESGKKQPTTDRISELAKNLNISSDALVFAASDVPQELNTKDKKDFERLQKNIISLLLFELTGELKEIA